MLLVFEFNLYSCSTKADECAWMSDGACQFDGRYTPNHFSRSISAVDHAQQVFNFT